MESSTRSSIDSSRLYAGVGAEAGNDFWSRTGWSVDAGWRPWRRNLWLRGRAGGGDYAPPGRAGGQYLELGVGLEYQRCWVRGVVCALGGVDGGYLHRHWNPRMDGPVAVPSYDERGGSLMPRLGVEVGSRVRVRVAAQARAGWVDWVLLDGASVGVSIVARL